MKFTTTHKPLRHPTRDAVNPADYVAIIGQTFARKEREPVLVIGTRQWDRWSLGRLGCPHPKAAAALNRVVQHLGITTLAGLAEHARAIGDFKGLGVTAYWTVLAILREAGYDVVDVHHEDVSYHTLKRQATKRGRRESPRLLKRRRSPTTTRPHALAADSGAST